MIFSYCYDGGTGAGVLVNHPGAWPITKSTLITTASA